MSEPTRRRAALLAFLLTLLMACATGSGTIAPPPDRALRVASYNVHYIDLRNQTGDWSAGDWEKRKGPLNQAFRALDADIVAFQEMESFAGGTDGETNLARDWLAYNNTDYAVAAEGDWRTFPSTQPIFYRRDRLKALDQGWFFFSETPDVIYSRSFDGGHPSFASWAVFRERGTGLEAGRTVVLAGDLNAMSG